jgi:hypothetical protein
VRPDPAGGRAINRTVPAILDTVNAIENHALATGTDNFDEPEVFQSNGSFTAMFNAGEKNPKQHPPPTANSNAFWDTDNDDDDDDDDD